MAVLVRAPQLADVDALATINLESWRSAYAGILPGPYLAGLEWSAYQARWVTRLRDGRKGVTVLVAEIEGEVVAFAIAGPYRRQPDGDPSEDITGWAELYAMYTDPARQGEGAGSALLDAVLGSTERAGFGEAVLWVLEANAPSRSWYAARGWRTEGAVSDFEAGGLHVAEIRLRHALAHESSPSASD